MASYKVTLLPGVVRKDLPKLSKKDAQRVMDKIRLLGTNPRPSWATKLSGREEYRARQGSYRILYVIEDTVKIVQVTKVRHRSNVYN